MNDRRNYMTKMAAGMASSFGLSSSNVKPKVALLKNVFVHHVFFWLKEPQNADAMNEFENGLNSLATVPQILSYHIGTPVESPREVVDDSFTFSYITFFKNKEDQETYQSHPIHLKFVEDCQRLWEKVIVYDAMD
jgi:hypothetical protein